MSVDLTGRWTGVYDYDDLAFEAAPFLVVVRQSGRAFEGVCTEPNTFVEGIEGELTAHIAGEVFDTRIRFVKRYDLPGLKGYAVRYAGSLFADGTRIEGRWTIALDAEASGPFVMDRAAPSRAERRRRTSAAASAGNRST